MFFINWIMIKILALYEKFVVGQNLKNYIACDCIFVYLFPNNYFFEQSLFHYLIKEYLLSKVN
jgi:hypothetical protein